MRNRNAGDTSTRASTPRNASSCDDALLAECLVQSRAGRPSPSRAAAAIGPRGEVQQRVELLRDRGGFFVLLELVGPLLEGRALALEVGDHLLRLVLGDEADELRQIVVLGDGCRLMKRCSTHRRSSRFACAASRNSRTSGSSSRWNIFSETTSSVGTTCGKQRNSGKTCRNSSAPAATPCSLLRWQRQPRGYGHPRETFLPPAQSAPETGRHDCPQGGPTVLRPQTRAPERARRAAESP